MYSPWVSCCPCKYNVGAVSCNGAESAVRVSERFHLHRGRNSTHTQNTHKWPNTGTCSCIFYAIVSLFCFVLSSLVYLYSLEGCLRKSVLVFGSAEGHLKAPVDAHLLWRNLIPSSPRLSVWPLLPPHTQQYTHTHGKYSRKEADTPKCSVTERRMIIPERNSQLKDIGNVMNMKA